MYYEDNGRMCLIDDRVCSRVLALTLVILVVQLLLY